MNNVGKLRLAGVVLAAVCVPVLSACGGEAAKSNADLLKEGAANMKTAKSYHLNVDLSQADQQVKMDGDIDVANKNSQLSMNAAGMDINSVTVGSAGYLSTDGGKTFTKSDSMNGAVTSFTGMWDSFKAADVDKAKDALKDGNPATETIDGVATKHMTGSAKDLGALANGTGSSGTTDGTIDIWVSTDAKPYIRQMKIDGTTDGKPVKGTLKWSNFDKALDIKAPPAQ